MQLLPAISICILASLVCFAEPLSGDYTIGGNNPDFLVISEAVASLENDGISGPVTFNLRGGIYLENDGQDHALFLGQNISGTSDANRIIFRPDPATGTTRDDVVLTRTNGEYLVGRGWVVEILADYITLQDLSIEYADTVGSAGDFSCVGLTSTPGGNLVEGVSVIGCRVYSSGNRMRQGIASTAGGHDIIFSNNTIEKVYWGIHCNGSNLNYTDLVISDNYITDLSYIYLISFYGTAIEVANGTNVSVTGNTIAYDGGSGISGIRITGNSTGARIEENLITEPRGWGWPCNGYTGIETASGANGVTIANNMIGSILATGGRGINISGDNNVITFNTVIHGYGSAGGFCTPTALTLWGNDNIIKNNIFVQHRAWPQPGYVMQIHGGTGNEFDYNVLYQAEETQKLVYAYGQLYATLEDWQAEGNDPNSINKLPQFLDEDLDPHLGGCSVVDPELIGIPIDGIGTDFDGEARDGDMPTMGADEAGGTLPEAFALPGIYASGDEVLHFTSGDLDGDDDIDIAISHLDIGSNDVSIMWNDGSGNLSAPEHMTFGTEPRVIKADDLDGDNAVDLLATTGNSDPSLTVRWGNPGGDFDAATELQFIKPVEDFLLVDLRNYGYLDVIQTHLGTVGTEPGDLSVLLNGGGSGRSFLWANMGPYAPGEHPSSTVSADFDGDTYADLAIVDYLNASVAILINKGAAGIIWNGFEDGVSYSVFGGSAPLHANIATADIDGDSKPDLLVGGEWGIGVDSLNFLRNNGDGSFSSAEKIPLDTYNRSETFTILDYENDGDTDIVTANVTHNLSLFLNDGSGNFEKFLLCQNSELGGEPLTILSNYFNDDPSADIATLTITDDVVISLNQEWIPTSVPSLDGQRVADGFALFQNYPNPFNPSTTIRYSLALQSDISIVIYDITGRRIKQMVVGREEQAGNYEMQWDGTNDAGNPVSSGVYIYRITAAGKRAAGNVYSQTRKMMLIR